MFLYLTVHLLVVHLVLLVVHLILRVLLILLGFVAGELGEVGYVPEASVTILTDGNDRVVIQPGQPSDLTLRMGILDNEMFVGFLDTPDDN